MQDVLLMLHLRDVIFLDRFEQSIIIEFHLAELQEVEACVGRLFNVQIDHYFTLRCF